MSLDDKSARRLFRRMYTWQFKRCRTSDEAAVCGIIARAMADGRPIPLVGYWGCGDRDRAGRPDREALEHLRRLDGRARDTWEPGLALTFILTDVHAAINGKDPAAVSSYLADVGRLVEGFGWRAMRLSELWEAGGYGIEAACHRVPELEGRWQALRVRPLLVRSARKHARGIEPEQAARRYHAACVIEAEVVPAAFPGHILFTYNGREYDEILPPLPKLYLYSLRRKTSVKPWFCD